MNFETMSKQRKMMLIAAAIGVVAMFLPWWSFIISINGMHGWGVLVFLCFVTTGAIAFMGDQTTNLTQTNWMFALIASGVAALIMSIMFLSNLDFMSLLSFGFYIALAASICLLVFTYTNRSSTDSVQSGFDNLKRSFDNKSTTLHSGSTTTTTNVSHTPTNDPTRPSV
jgi:peptidoglycan/LPS O-acetylase OafA/YrhL